MIFCQACQFLMQKLSELIVNNASEVCHPLAWGCPVLQSQKVPLESAPGKYTPQYPGGRAEAPNS